MAKFFLDYKDINNIGHTREISKISRVPVHKEIRKNRQNTMKMPFV